MKIAIDANQANKKIKTGVEKLSFDLIKALQRVSQKNRFSNLNFTLISQFPLQEDLEDMPPRWQSVQDMWRHPFWTQSRLPILIKDYDLYFTPGYIPPLFCPVKSACIVHDIGFEKNRKLYILSDYIKQKIAFEIVKYKADIIITPTEAVGEDIVEKFPVLKDRVYYIPIGIDPDRFAVRSRERVEEIKAKYGLPDKFLLYVGRITEKKNLLNLIRGFIRAKDRNNINDSLNLVIAGSIYSQKYFQKIDDVISGRDDMLYLGYVKDDDLPYIMNLSCSLALVSFEEGFGIPVIEALACGKRVLLSDIKVFKEIAGKYGRYVNPEDIDDIAGGIKDVYQGEDSDFVDDVKKYVINKYSWDKIAEKYLDLFLKL